MAQKREDDYVIVDKATVLYEAISDINKRTSEEKIIAVDCEGVKLSRNGKLTVLLLAVKNKVYIFDVLILGSAVFDDGLRGILENVSIEKLLFDCRQDADILWHNFNVKLTSVLDLQLLEIMYRLGVQYSGNSVENVYGYKKCLQIYVRDQKLLHHKLKGAQLLERESDVWARRPLTNDLLQYCCVDVKGLFKLYEILKREDKYLGRLRVASGRYLERYRSLAVRTHDAYEENAYLPLNIIPAEGQLSFPCETTRCTGCKWLFPPEEFSQNQERKREQKCRVCMKIKYRLGSRGRPFYW